MKNDDQICILCRGSSMSHAENYFHDLNDDMIIVNEFNDELKNNFVDELFKKKNITHIVSRDTGLSNLRPEYYRKYGINKAILNIFKEEYNNYPSMRRLLEHYELTTSCLPDIMKPFQKEGGGFPTTGVISIVYSTVALGKKDIHIAGMDFYERDYFNNTPANDHQKKKGILMKQFIKDFMGKHQNINYTFYTDSGFNPDLENVKIINKLHGEEN